MTFEGLFIAANAMALAGWVLLAAAAFGRPALVGKARAIGVLLAVGYLVILVGKGDGARALIADYSLRGIGAFFSDPALQLLGWVHYLAFDLWVGSWEVEEAERRGMSKAWLLPSLLLTWLIGPVGLLVFLAARAVQRGGDASSA